MTRSRSHISISTVITYYMLVVQNAPSNWRVVSFDCISTTLYLFNTTGMSHLKITESSCEYIE